MGHFQNVLIYYGAMFDALEENVPTCGSVAEQAYVEQCLL
jgi:hypothetical protein